MGKVLKSRHTGGVITSISETKEELRKEISELRKNVVDLESRIGEYERTVEELKKVDSKWFSILSSMTDMVFVFDENERFTFHHTPDSHKLFLSPEKFIGKKHSDIMPSPVDKLFVEAFNKNRKKEIASFEYELEIENRSQWFAAKMSPIFINDEFKGSVAVVRDITEQKQTLDALRESEGNFRALAENANDAILIAMGEGVHVFTNRRASEITGYTPTELLNSHIMDIAHPNEHKKLMRRYKKRLEGEIQPDQYESAILRKDGKKVPIEVTASKTSWQGQVADLVILRDITERKHAEEELRKQLMKFRLEEGNIYLIKEAVPAFMIEVFRDILHVSYPALVISRQTEKELRSILDGDFDYYWLAEKEGEKTFPPNLGDMGRMIEDLPSKNAVLIDRLDYLIFKNGFDSMLSFVQNMREIAYFHNHIIILSIDPAVLSERELALLEKETREVIPLQKAWLPDYLFEVLKYLHSQNNMGVKPSHTKVSKALRISKPTVGKRMRRLVELGYIIESNVGKSKVLELTIDGKRLFME